MIALFAAVLLAQTPATVQPQAHHLHEAACHAGKKKLAAICGTYTVYEDRAAGAGRILTLKFVVIKAAHPTHRAIVFNPGGPGASSTDFADDIADGNVLNPIAALHDRYDVLLLDNRGTGGSAPQECDFAPAAQPQLYFRQMWPDDLVRICRAKLAQYANLDLYSTQVAVDDLDEVRAALGYPKLVLYGGSYGTRFYLAYARTHPGSVESLVLLGVAPPHFLILPLEDAQGAQSAIDGLIAACAADTTCRTHFPHFASQFTAVARRFASGPVRVTLRNAKGATTLWLSKEVFDERVRQLLYLPEGGAYLPFVVDRAYHGDYEPLATVIDVVTQAFAGGDGLNLSVSCAEDVPFITDAAVRTSSAQSFEGDARVRAQQRACALWNVAPVAASFVEPVRSNLPMLMVSGTDDPATPPKYAREALPYLPNARILSIQGGTHDTESSCADGLVVAFVRAGSAKGLRLDRCSVTYRRPPFATSMAGFGD